MDSSKLIVKLKELEENIKTLSDRVDKISLELKTGREIKYNPNNVKFCDICAYLARNNTRIYCLLTHNEVTLGEYEVCEKFKRIEDL